MFDAPQPAVRKAARPVVTTPEWLGRAMAVVVLLAVLAGGASLWAAASIRGTAQTIGRDAEPSVALALRMGATLAEMNTAALVDSLTDGGAATGTSARFRQAEIELAADLVEAARNVTYGEAEAEPLRQLQRWVLAYQEAVAEARTLGAGDAWVTAHRVQWADRVNGAFAAPAADALAQANADVLEARYGAYRSGSLVVGGVAFGAFALLLVALAGIQLWLARRMRRLVNPLLAAGTAVAAVAGLWFGYAVLTERADLRAAKADAYDSLHVLFQAKREADALRADMSMWLLDPASRPSSQARLNDSLHALVGTDLANAAAAQSASQALRRALALERDGKPLEASTATPHVGGLLGTELDNVTFGPAERQPATESFDRLLDVRALIQAVQGQAGQEEQRFHNHVTAGMRWLGRGPTDGETVFAALQRALDQTIAANQAEFDRRVASSLGLAGLMPFVTTGALLVAVALALAGLWQRLREYR